MLRNYLKTAMRHLLRQKIYSAINILGLAIGMTCCMLILLYVRFELSYDSFHQNAERIYRVAVEWQSATGKTNKVATPYPLATALAQQYPQLDIARLLLQGETVIEANQRKFYENGWVFADATFFDVFPPSILKGQYADPLADPNAVVISATIAAKYFGDENPVGKVLKYNNHRDYHIAAVFADLPANSHCHFDIVAPLVISDRDWLDSWTIYSSLYTYILLPAHMDSAVLQGDLAGFLDNYPLLPGHLGQRIFLQPIRDIHLYSHGDSEIRANNSMGNILILSTLAVFILAIACINFINLSTARSAYRAREIGVRKVLGAARLQLVKQFLGESISIAVIAVCLACVLVELLLPAFSDLVGVQLEFLGGESWVASGWLVVMAIAVGLLAGFYPALFLSGHEPIAVLKGKLKIGRQHRSTGSLRKGLIVVQFAISAILLAGTLVVYEQLFFLQHSNLGFERQYNVVLPIFNGFPSQRYETLKNRLTEHPDILSATACKQVPAIKRGMELTAHNVGRDAEEDFAVEFYAVDDDFLDHFGIEVKAGRMPFTEWSFAGAEGLEVMINEVAMRKMGYASPEQAIGQKVSVSINNMVGVIVGVVGDFHTASLHERIQPVIVSKNSAIFEEIVVKISAENMPQTIKFLGAIWHEFVPDYPFQYAFLEDEVKRLYEKEEQTSRIVSVASILALFIACTGLFGLATFAAEQRTKEIAIRKVAGASVADLLSLLSKEFVLLLVVANICAWPVVYFVMQEWLRNFAYHIDIEWWIFACTGLAVLLLSLFTVSAQTLRAALSNPAAALRYE